MEYNRKQTSLEPIDILKFDTVKTGAVFKQYDINTSILELELVANGEPVHLKDEKVYVTVKSSNSLSTQLLSKYSGASVKEKDNYKVLLRAKKSRRRDVNNIIDVYISPLALENSGEMIAEVMIIDLIKEERITSQSFTFEIKPSITPNRPSESAYKLVKDLDGTYITDAEDVQLLVAEVEPNFKLSFVGTRVNEILEKANNFDVEDNTNKIQALQEKDVELESKISNLEKKDSSLDGEIASLKSSDQSIEEEIQGLKSKDESIESKISQLKSKDTAIDGEIDKLKNADETIKSDINSKYEELKQKTDATNNEVMKLKAQDTTLGESIRTNKGLIDVINPKVATLEQENQNVKNRVSVLEGDMNLAKSNISSLQSSNTELSQKVEGVEQGNASIDKILKQLQSDVERYKGSIELLESKVPVWKDFKGESFKVENSFYGKSRDLSIKGRTLQNFAKQEKFVDNSDNQHMYIQWSSTSDLYEPGLWTIKNSTGYYLEYDIRNKQTKSYIRGLKSNKSFTVNLNDNEFISNMQALGRNNVPIDKNTEKMLKENCVVLKGDRLDIIDSIDYFEGIKSSGEVEGNKISILSTGKNLAKLDLSNPNITPFEDGFRLECARLYGLKQDIFNMKGKYKENTQYVFSYLGKLLDNSNNNNYRLRIYYTDGSYTDNFNYSSHYSKVVMKSLSGKTIDMITGYYGTLNGDFIVKDLLLEEGTQATQYEEYKEDKKDILLQNLGFDEGLRGLNNSVYDELNSIRGVAVKRVEKYTMTGDEQLTSNLRGNFIYCSFKLEGSVSRSGTEAICNKFIYIDGLWNQDDPKVQNKEGFDLSGSAILSFQLPISKLETPNTEGIKKYFKSLHDSGNPVIVYYELAEPVETPLNEDVNFGTLDDITYVSLENNIKNELSCQCQVSLASSRA